MFISPYGTVWFLTKLWMYSSHINNAYTSHYGTHGSLGKGEVLIITIHVFCHKLNNVVAIINTFDYTL